MRTNYVLSPVAVIISKLRGYLGSGTFPRVFFNIPSACPLFELNVVSQIISSFLESKLWTRLIRMFANFHILLDDSNVYLRFG